MDEITCLKLSLFACMSLFTIVVGLAPIWLLKSLHKKGVTDPTAHGHGNESLALSLLTCFSGGVFLATCLLHLIPEVREHVERFERSYGFKFSYPTEQMLICSGFFLMYFMEKTISRYLLSAAHNHSCEEDNEFVQCDDEQESDEQVKNYEPAKSIPHEISCDCSLHENNQETRAVFIVSAIALHAIMEGLTMGIQEDSSKIWAIFISLTVHKLIEDFVVGFQLARKNESVCLVVSLTIFMSLMTPLGGALGILIQNAPIRTQAHDLFILCCQGTTAGTFIYVALVEVLMHERDNKHPVVLKSIMFLLGFGLIGLVHMFTENHSHLHSAHTESSNHYHIKVDL